MSFFDHVDYRAALKELVLERKKVDARFGFHSLADAARIQRPYMSKVISGTADLSLDQLHLITETLKLDVDRSDFLELLLNFDRSAVQSRKRKLKRKIDEIAESKRSISANIKSKIIVTKANDDYAPYYLNHWTQITHVALSIARYAKEPKLLAEVLGIPPSEMQKILQDLMSMNLLKSEQGEMTPLDNHLHLNRSSPLFHAWHSQLRMAGLQRQRAVPEDSSYSFTAVFSATDEVRKKTRSRFLEFLKEFEADVTAAEARNAYQMSFDLFPWA